MLEETIILHFCILVGWQTPGMCTPIPCPWKTLLIDPGTLYPPFWVKHKHGPGNFYNTVTHAVTTNRLDLAQKIKPIFHFH